MNFEQYMDEKIPTWRTDVSMEELENLKNLHSNVNKWQGIANNTMDMAFNHNKSGIDYSTDYEKANNEVGRYLIMLENAITEIRQRLGLEPSVKENEANKVI